MPSMHVRRTLIIMTLIVIILPTVAFRAQNRGVAQGAAFSLSSLQLYEVERGDVALTVSAIGQIEADESVSLAFTTAGTVQDVFVSRDDFVLAGDVLVQLEATAQGLQYQQAELQVQRAELALEELLSVDEGAIAVAEAAVDSALGAYISLVNSVSDEDIAAADLAYQQALDAIDELVITRDRIGGRFGGDSPQWEAANARIGEATFNAEIARLRAEQLRNSTQAQGFAAWARVVQARRELERVLAGPTEFEQDSASINVEQAENQLADAVTQVERARLTAPFDGVVTALNAEAGLLIAPGVTVLELTDVSPLRLTVQVDEIDIGLVQVGQSARVMLDALQDVSIPAEVIAIAPVGAAGEGVVRYDVDVALTIDDPRVRVGMTAEAVIVIDEALDVIEVPNLYIRRDRNSGAAFVNVLRDETRLEEVPVMLGIQGRETSEIISGLAEGDLVAVNLSGAGDIDLFGG